MENVKSQWLTQKAERRFRAFSFDLIQKQAAKTQAFNAQQYILLASDTNNGLVLRRLSALHSPQ